MNERTKKQTHMTIVLLILYLVVMSWIILFKLQFSLSSLSGVRKINWIPLNGSGNIYGAIPYSEVVNNILIFVPFGLYLGMWKKKWPVWKKILPICLVSLFYEAAQYVFAIGISDITDLLGNTLGGIIGLFLYFAFLKVFKSEKKANHVLLILASFATLCVIALLTILILANTG